MFQNQLWIKQEWEKNNLNNVQTKLRSCEVLIWIKLTKLPMITARTEKLNIWHQSPLQISIRQNDQAHFDQHCHVHQRLFYSEFLKFAIFFYFTFALSEISSNSSHSQSQLTVLMLLQVSWKNTNIIATLIKKNCRIASSKNFFLQLMPSGPDRCPP